MTQADDAITLVEHLKSLADRVRWARKERDLTQPQLAKLAKVGKSTVGMIESGKRVSPNSIPRIAEALGVRAFWLTDGSGSPAQHLIEGLPSDGHSMSLPHATLSAPLLKWGELMTGRDLGQFFRTQLPDDAMAPALPRGIEVLWSTTRREAPDRIVLVLAHGAHYARRYRQGRIPGTWDAVADNPAFASFNSAEDRAELVAVLKGTMEPDD